VSAGPARHGRRMNRIVNLIVRAKQTVKSVLPQWSLRALQRLLRPLRRPPRAVAYAYRPEDTVIADFAEFGSLPVSEIVACMRSFRHSVQDEWKKLGALNFEEASRIFYVRSRAYIFDLLSSNYNRKMVVEKLNRFGPSIIEVIRQHPGKRFLEFGGGLGVFCEIVAGFGKDVTYLDIPGRISEFAIWRFRKYRIPVRTIIVEPGRLDGLETYDIIYTDAVLEHMPPAEQQRAVKVLANHLLAGGILVLLIDLTGPTPDNPTHEVVDINDLHSTLDECGLRCQDGRGRFWSIWKRP